MNIVLSVIGYAFLAFCILVIGFGVTYPWSALQFRKRTLAGFIRIVAETDKELLDMKFRVTKKMRRSILSIGSSATTTPRTLLIDMGNAHVEGLRKLENAASSDRWPWSAKSATELRSMIKETETVLQMLQKEKPAE